MRDPSTQVLLRLVEARGYRLTVVPGTPLLSVATNRRSGEHFAVRADDPYAAARELAAKVGIDLEG
jgi:hypothetical protein